MTAVEPGAGFSVVDGPPLPVQLAAGEHVVLGLSFETAEEGTHASVLRVEYNGRSSPTEVPTRATALESRRSAPLRARFDPVASHARDVLLFVPPGGPDGMAVSGLYSVLAALEAAGVDHRVAMAPIGAREPALGVLEGCAGFPLWLEPGIQPELRRAIARCMVSVNDPRPPQAGLGALQAALGRVRYDRPWTPSANATFFRPEVPLEAIVPATSESWFMPQAGVEAFFDDLAPPVPGVWRIHGADRPREGFCSSPDSRLAPFIDATGGVFTNACNPDWPAFWDALARVLTRPRAVFPVGQAALVDDLVVRLDGQEVPTSSSTWTHAPERRAIVFARGAEPADGSELTIDYVLACPP
jgi:hypothetical protein